MIEPTGTEPKAQPNDAPANAADLAAAHRRRRRAATALLPLAAALTSAALVGCRGAPAPPEASASASASASALPPEVPLPPPPAAPPPGPPPAERAAALRRDATTDCAGRRWLPCLSELKQASQLDPSGDRTWAVRRMRGEAERGARRERVPPKAGPRELAAQPQAELVAALAALKGRAVRVVCGPGDEVERYCGQLAAAMGKAGMTVTRAAAPAGASVPRAVTVSLATGAEDYLQYSAETLVIALDRADVAVVGPDDGSADAKPPITVTVGPP